MPEPILQLKNVGCNKEPGQPIFANVNLEVDAGDVIILQGKSGCGKTTLLKCFSHLNVYEGEIFYRGRTPQSYGIPKFRTRVQYVPQRPSLLPGTPRDFLTTILRFSARKAHPKAAGGNTSDGEVEEDERLRCPIEVAASWGIDEELWDRNWSNLSGGESQRIALATAVGLKTAEVLLLDEPTSALDAVSAENVEKYLLDEIQAATGKLKALIWITHSEEQGKRVGTRFLRIVAGGLHDENQHADV